MALSVTFAPPLHIRYRASRALVRFALFAHSANIPGKHDPLGALR